ncbi:MAG TPA: hypothetical protein VLH40_05800 [Atribacteraceae bacterium]|nr:hypothetical protein [Atribacteraceae bacterium]
MKTLDENQKIAWLIEPSREVWDSLIHHPFPRDLAAGILPLETFRYYLAQDNHYLEDFLRTVGLLVAKAATSELRRFAVTLLQDTLTGELAMHEAIERDFPFSGDCPINNVTYAYGDFLLRQAYQGSDCEILTALAPCVVSYRLIARRLSIDPVKDLPAAYQLWLDSYRGEAYGALVERFLTLLDERLSGQVREQRERARLIFRKACDFEFLFWEESYRGRLRFMVKD